MKAKSLITCSNSILAYNIKERLEEQGVHSWINDQTLEPSFALGASPCGFEVLVDEKDYPIAKQLADEIEQERKDAMPWCPECGSDEVMRQEIVHRSSRKIHLLVASILAVFSIVGIVLTVSGIKTIFAFTPFTCFFSALFFYQAYKDPKEVRSAVYHCNKCGKDFTR